ncbi:putative glycolipid-binding domain-containing protein [Nesterenkonia sandarakina]|uniref:Glycolipid-binding protein n=1 Tax=Nesterenkonia sandarakina TaxID=272918 RepID=A0A7Z0J232_9MICC|nr:putative glycolipid-binding domain-containing protein [Nesterenkonia sandarakina]NYJ15727.1 hypothetical protein [Nesterenkonia sandarakina]
MTSHLLTWSGIDDPDRLDHACVEIDSTSMHAVGGTQARHFSSSWELEIGEDWTTRSLHVTTRGFGWSRWLELTRAESGRWSAESGGRGDTKLPPPGLEEPATLDDATDCDLGLCPVTNTMPIRRLGLLDRDVPSTHLVMAWVEMPSLRVQRSEQVYASKWTDERRLVKYSTLRGDFSADLTVDSYGLVIDYPTLAHRISSDE